MVPRRPRLVTFDVFGTLFPADETTSREVMAAILAANDLDTTPEALGQRWWDLSYRVATEGFVTVREATRRALALLLEEAGAEDDPVPYADRLLDGWSQADPYLDTRGALDALAEFDLGVISNVDDDILDALLDGSSLRDRFAVVVTSEACRAYKPNPDLFHRALEGAGCNPGQALHLGDSPVDDVLGAKRVGMMAGWINRREEALRGKVPEPDLVAPDLEAAAEVIRNASPGP